VRALGQAWYRHSLAEWDDVTPPRTAGPYPDTLDWLQFRIDDAYAHMRWRVELIRAMDPHHPITAHGVAGTLTTMAPGGADDWRAAAEVDSYGLTWVACRKGDEPWKQWHAVDLTRAASRGKDYWHAEAQGGPLWMQPQVIGRPRDDGRIAEPEDMRLWHLTSFAGGARGLLYPRWRPLLDGPLFGAFGPYGMDGSRTARSRMTSRLARWVAAPEQEALWRSRPVRGEVGIVYAPETQLFTYAQQGSTALYADAMMGAYRGFYDLNVQADWVHIDHIDEYDTLYLPLPVMLTQTSADRLIAWVAAGGTLISEGCPGYFGDRGRVGVTQPNLGLDALFGVRQTYVEFTPDILGGLRYNLDGVEAPGGIFMQAYEPFDSGAGAGTPVGWYAGGRVAAVDHAYGRGRTRLLGTMTGAGHGVQGNGRPAFDALARWAGITPHVRCSDPQVVARLHDGEGGVYLWVANPTRRDRPVRLRLGGRWAGLRPALSLWGAEATVEGDDMVLIAGARDVAVLVLV
jgi:beta-galactosidase